MKLNNIKNTLSKISLWSMIAEIKPPIDYDFRQYTKEKLDVYKKESKKFFNYSIIELFITMAIYKFLLIVLISNV